MKNTLATLLAGLILTSCSTTSKVDYSEKYGMRQVYPFKIEGKLIVTSPEEIRDKYKGKYVIGVQAFHQNKNGFHTIYVPYMTWKKPEERFDNNGNLLPNFQHFGHEVFHYEDFGGMRFHD